MAGNIFPKYDASNQGVTITLASLAAGSSTGRSSTSITATTYFDVLVQLKVKTGAAGGNKQVIVYGYGSSDGGTTWTDGAAGIGTDTTVLFNFPTPLRVVGIIPTPVNSTTYVGGPFSTAAAFGGVLPNTFGYIVVNDDGNALSATAADHTMFYQGVYAQYT